MNGPYFVEILDRHEEVRQRHRISVVPIRIGRGYRNDCILDDPHVSANHAVIEIDGNGALVLRDLDSKNGVICEGKREQVLPINGDTIFRLGHSNLRVRSEDCVVPNEVIDNRFHGWEGWPPALTGLLLIILLTALDTWSSDTQKFDGIRYLISIAGMVSFGLIWCGPWSFAGRLFDGHARFGRHLFVFSCGLLASQVWGLFSSIAAYAYSLEFLTRFSMSVGVAISSGTVFFHLLTIKPRRRKRLAIISSLLAVLGCGLVLMNNYQRNGRLGDELFMSTVLPPAVRQSENLPTEDFINDAIEMKPVLDAARLELVKGDSVEDVE